ncbi:cutinase, partial [Elsinoe ampelina]
MGNAQLGAAGGPQMASDAKNALAKCPNTKLIIGGYSQGAMVATNAVKAQGLPADKVVAALLFGNPFQNQGGGKIGSIPTLSTCNAGDGVCTTGGFVITAAHLTYTSDGSVQKAVQFAQ